MPVCVHARVCQDSWAQTLVTHPVMVPPQLAVSWRSMSTASPCLPSCCKPTCALVKVVEKNYMSSCSSSQNKSWPFDVQFSSESHVPVSSLSYLAHNLSLRASSWRRATRRRLKRKWKQQVVSSWWRPFIIVLSENFAVSVSVSFKGSLHLVVGLPPSL